jgi:2-keto-4-pentenoate hydratase/2-oxohepta-3-ene-1,7-dioic acid hydratase in catechol pathway
MTGDGAEQITQEQPMSLRLVTYDDGRGARAGIITDAGIADAAAATGEPAYGTMLGILADWRRAQPKLGEAAARGGAEPLPLDRAKLLAPLPFPGTIYCAGANYRDHLQEMSHGEPAKDAKALGLRSWHFIKSSHSVVGPDAPIPYPSHVKSLDWEVELAVVIGETCRRVAEKDALGVVAGYAVANDLSARDLGRRPNLPPDAPFRQDWTAHKSFDGSCPLGPWLTAADGSYDPQNLRIIMAVNGVTKQDSNTSFMIFGIAEQIADLSARMTLYPGDVILTGTPAGVGAGRGEFLKAGDTMTAAIAHLGELTNTLVPAAAG